MESIIQYINSVGDCAAVISANSLETLKKDYEGLLNREQLNDYQKRLVKGRFSFEIPDTGFAVSSVIVVASPSPLIRVHFNWGGRRIPVMIPPTYLEYGRKPDQIVLYLDNFLKSHNYHIAYADNLPEKYIAVRSGLGIYGRNNICYVEKLGSFMSLSLFFSDVPYDSEQVLKDMRMMDICNKCLACIKNCPTGAIMKERILINNEICITYHNELDGNDFPEWIAPDAHNALVGCMRCQNICPVNSMALDNIIEFIEFSEEETFLLLKGTEPSDFPPELADKVTQMNMTGYLGALPRNLRSLLEQ